MATYLLVESLAHEASPFAALFLYPLLFQTMEIEMAVPRLSVRGSNKVALLAGLLGEARRGQAGGWRNVVLAGQTCRCDACSGGSVGSWQLAACKVVQRILSAGVFCNVAFANFLLLATRLCRQSLLLNSDGDGTKCKRSVVNHSAGCLPSRRGEFRQQQVNKGVLLLAIFSRLPW